MDRPIADMLEAAEAGSAEASEQLFVALYRELHRLAERQVRRGGRELTLGATTLLHEAYLQIAGRDGVHFADRTRFLGYASRAMRGLVIDHRRRARAQKRGGDAVEVTLTDAVAPGDGGSDAGVDLDRLSDALDELAALEPALAELVDLHFFCGYSHAEIAELRNVSTRTVQRDWRKARLLLHSTMLGDEPAGGAGH